MLRCAHCPKSFKITLLTTNNVTYTYVMTFDCITCRYQAIHWQVI